MPDKVNHEWRNTDAEARAQVATLLAQLAVNRTAITGTKEERLERKAAQRDEAGIINQRNGETS